MTLAGFVAVFSTTLVAPPQEPILLVAMPSHGAPFVAAELSSTISVTSPALVLWLKSAAKMPLVVKLPEMLARLSELVALEPVAYFSRLG